MTSNPLASSPSGLARYIYVLADSPLRQRYHAYSSRCSDILLALFKRIHLLFPRAVVSLPT